MARTVLSPQRLTEVKRTNIGRIIIFCEGKTEKHYFDYFAGIIQKNKYTNIEVVIEKAIDNARRLEETYKSEGRSVFLDIKEMNPYTNVYKLVEQFMAEIS